MNMCECEHFRTSVRNSFSAKIMIKSTVKNRIEKCLCVQYFRNYINAREAIIEQKIHNIIRCVIYLEVSFSIKKQFFSPKKNFSLISNL